MPTKRVTRPSKSASRSAGVAKPKPGNGIQAYAAATKGFRSEAKVAALADGTNEVRTKVIVDQVVVETKKKENVKPGMRSFGKALVKKEEKTVKVLYEKIEDKAEVEVKGTQKENVRVTRKRKVRDDDNEEEKEDIVRVHGNTQEAMKGEERITINVGVKSNRKVKTGSSRKEKLDDKQKEIEAAVPSTRSTRKNKKTKTLEYFTKVPSKNENNNTITTATATSTTQVISLEEEDVIVTTRPPSDKESTPEPPSSIVKTTNTSRKTNSGGKSTPKSLKKDAALDSRQPTLRFSNAPRQLSLEAEAENDLSISLNAAIAGNAQEERGLSGLPEDLQHFINIHTHLLTALHLHLAQNGPNALPSFKVLKPHIERLGRRNIDLEDLRKVCWMSKYSLQSSQEGEGEDKSKDSDKDNKGSGSYLRLVDYGGDKMVVEIVSPDGEITNGIGEVDKLKEAFLHKAREWFAAMSKDGEERKEQGTDAKFDISALLPLCPINIYEKKSIIDSTRRKGQKRKQDLDNIIRGKSKMEVFVPFKSKITKPQSLPLPSSVQGNKEDKTPSTSSPALASALVSTQAPTPETRKLSLLDRIRLKQAVLETKPGVSMEDIKKEAYKQKLPTLLPMLLQLRLTLKSQAKKSMGLEEVIVMIKGSCRVGLETETILGVIGLAGNGDDKRGLEREWIRVVDVGGIRAVVFR